MMNLIDRYVYVVTEHLPEKNREDVSRELRGNIEDMLPENPTESDIRKVLLELGNPKKLASEYIQSKRYLIGPSLYDSYISILKLVTGIVVIVFASIALLDGIFSSSSSDSIFEVSIKVFVSILVAIIEGLIQAGVWVTLVFAILERTGVNESEMPYVKKEWSLDDLPKLPVSDKRKISSGETIFSIFFTILFTALLYFRPQFIGMYRKDHNGFTQVTTLFNIERLHSYFIIIFIFAIIQLSIFIWKFISKRWTMQLAVANAAFNIAFCILTIVMLRDNSLFNAEFLPQIANYATVSITLLESIWFWSIRITVSSIILISLWDSIDPFIKCRK